MAAGQWTPTRGTQTLCETCEKQKKAKQSQKTEKGVAPRGGHRPL